MVITTVFFYIIGKFSKLPYDIKNAPLWMRTQMQRKYVAEATHLRRRISQSEILFCKGEVNLNKIGKYVI